MDSRKKIYFRDRRGRIKAKRRATNGEIMQTSLKKTGKIDFRISFQIRDVESNRYVGLRGESFPVELSGPPQQVYEAVKVIRRALETWDGKPVGD